jgi:molecular chaperone DnaJ
MSENYYTILGINENASPEEIKKAYRTLQMKWHPDKNGNSQESINMTQKLNQAYEILGDEQKKEEYDFNRKNPNPFANLNGGGGGIHHINVNDLFGSLFGGGMTFGFPGAMGVQGMPPGANIHIFHGGFPFQKPDPIVKQIELTLEQVLTGLSIPIEIERWIIENNKHLFIILRLHKINFL